MDSNRALAAFLLAAQDVADLAARTGALESKLLAAAIDPLLINCDLYAGQRLMREHGEATRMVIRRLPLPKLKSLSGKWNPYRFPKAAGASSDDLIRELTALAQDSMKPAPKPPVIGQFDLEGAQRWAREHRELMLGLIGGLTLPKVKALSNKWNPHRVPAASQAQDTELLRELTALAQGSMTPAPKPPVVADLSLEEAQRWTREHRELMLALIGGLSLAKKRALSKKWNPFRANVAQVRESELRNELKGLALGQISPAEAPAPVIVTGKRPRAAAAGAPRGKRSAPVAAE